MCRVNRIFLGLIVNDTKLWKNYLQAEYGESIKSLPTGVPSYMHLYIKKVKEEAARLNFTPGRYIVSVMENCAEFTPRTEWEDRTAQDWWQNRFWAEMAGLEMCKLSPRKSQENAAKQQGNMDGGDVTLPSGLKIGWYRFLTISDAQKKFKNHPFLCETTECPFVGNTVGYINFDVISPTDGTTLGGADITDVKAALTEFIRMVSYETRGIFARTDTKDFCHSVSKESITLEYAFSKFGMNDGDALLDSDKNSPYIQYILKEAQQELEQVPGMTDGSAKVYYLETRHNPIRYNGPISDKLQCKNINVWLLSDVANNTQLWEDSI